MAFDPTKPVQTRDGRKARIICTDRHLISGRPIVVLVEGNGEESVYCYHETGRYHIGDSDHPIDLVNIPVKRKGWVNVHPTAALGQDAVIRGGAVHRTRELADKAAGLDRIDCVPIEWEEPA